MLDMGFEPEIAKILAEAAAMPWSWSVVGEGFRVSLVRPDGR